ncbi:MAG TPA: lyase [Terriglobia bacterium]|nr:lyase [Terriglobia bacterium]
MEFSVGMFLLAVALFWHAPQAQGQGRPAGNPAELPAGPGREVVAEKCSSCHNLNRVTEMRNSREGWAEVVRMMVTSFSAELTPEEVATATDYLATHFAGSPVAADPLPPLPPDNVTIPIKEWPVPWKGTRPRDPAVAADGTIYFVGQQGHYVGHFDPVTEQFKRYELGDGVGPHNQIIDRQGYVWFAGNRVGYIGRLDPKTGEIKKYSMPDPAVRDPHTLVLDDKDNIWFTAQQANFVGKLDTKTGEIRLVKMNVDGARPYGILVAPDGSPWFNQFGTNRIGQMEPNSMEVRNYTLPDPKTRDRRIARTPDGYIWYTDYARGYLGRLDPKTGHVTEYEAPARERSQPYALAADDKGRLWFVETGVKPNRFVGFDPKSEKMFSVTEIPSTGGAVRHMVFDPKTRSIWFGTDASTIGRASIP